MLAGASPFRLVLELRLFLYFLFYSALQIHRSGIVEFVVPVLHHRPSFCHLLWTQNCEFEVYSCLEFSCQDRALLARSHEASCFPQPVRTWNCGLCSS